MIDHTPSRSRYRARCASIDDHHVIAAFYPERRSSAGVALRFLCIAITLGFTLSGCVTPMNTRIPSIVHRPAEMERREAQIHDPYPDSKFGPDTGVRPLGFENQRSEPQRAKDRYFTSMLRTQGGMPQSSAPPVTPYPTYGGYQQMPGQPISGTPIPQQVPPQPQIVQPYGTPMYYAPSF